MTVKKLDITANREAIILLMAVTRLRLSVVKLRRNWDPLNESMLRRVESLDLVYHCFASSPFYQRLEAYTVFVVGSARGLEYLGFELFTFNDLLCV